MPGSPSPAVAHRSVREWWPYLGGGLLISLIIAVLAGVTVWQEVQRTRERSVVVVENTARLLAQHIGDVLGAGDTLLRTVAYDYTEQQARGTFEAARFHAHLEHLLSVNQGFVDIRVLDAQGVLRHGTGTAVAPINLSDREYFFRLRDLPPHSAQAATVFAGPILTRLTKQWVLVMARRLERPDGRFAGVVFLNLRTDAFAPLFASLQLGSGGTVVLRTTDHVQIDRYPRLGHPDQGVGNRKVSQTLVDLVRTAPDSGTYEALAPLDQVRRLYAYRAVGPYPFYVLAGEASRDVLRSLSGTAYALLGLSAATILLTLVGVRRMYRRSLQRMRERISRQAELIIDASPLPVLVIDAGNVVRQASQAAQELFAQPSTPLLGLSGAELVAPSSRAQQTELVRATQASHRAPPGPTQVDLLGRRGDGTVFPMRATRSFIELDGGHYAIVVLEDRTERQRREAERQALLRLQTAILAHSAYSIIATDPQGLITLFNPAAERLLGYQADEVVGRHTPVLFDTPHLARSCTPAQEAALFQQRIVNIRQGGTELIEKVYHRKDGRSLVVSRSASALVDEQGQLTGFLGMVEDITAVKAAQEQLKELAHYDPLTRLANRTLFFELLEQSMALARRNRHTVALLFLDLDHFKPVNDTWGHAVGDLVLREVAERIQGCLRASDVAGRVGGDEFLVMLTQVGSAAAAVLVADKIRAALCQPIVLKEQTVSVGVCIGIALYPQHGLSSQDLAQHADAAMYHAKVNGRNGVVLYQPELAESVSDR